MKLFNVILIKVLEVYFIENNDFPNPRSIHLPKPEKCVPDHDRKYNPKYYIINALEFHFGLVYYINSYFNMLVFTDYHRHDALNHPMSNIFNQFTQFGYDNQSSGNDQLL